MTVTLTVDATWRIQRMEIAQPYDPNVGSIVGYSEALLQSPDDGATVGTLPGARIERSLNEVFNDTVNVYGRDVRFIETLDALRLFLEKWRVEDAERPVPEVLRRVPPAAPLTPME